MIRTLTRTAAVTGAVATLALPVGAASASDSGSTSTPQACAVVIGDNSSYTCDPGKVAGFESAARTLQTTKAATMWTETGYSGTSLTFYKSGGDCTAAYRPIESSFDLAARWRNNFESVKTFNHCDVQLVDTQASPNRRSVWIDQSSNFNNLTHNWNNRADRVRFS